MWQVTSNTYNNLKPWDILQNKEVGTIFVVKQKYRIAGGGERIQLVDIATEQNFDLFSQQLIERPMYRIGTVRGVM